MLLPRATLVDVPGFGVDQLGLALQYGGVTLVEASAENALGIDIDEAAVVSQPALAAFLARSGGLQLEVEEQLVRPGGGGSGQVRFEPGAQVLDGEHLAEYWGFRERGEPELDTFAHQQKMWDALLAAAADRRAARQLWADGVPQFETSAEASFVTDVLTDLSEAHDAGGVRYAARVQVLNGVGTPGIGQAVDQALEGDDFRVVLTDNARSFDFEQTRILVYGEDEASMEAPRRVRERLGVGTILVSRQPQSVVDVTIVVGADFQPRG